MGKIILEFDSYEERDEAEAALNVWKYQRVVDNVWNTLFRGRHKHGYSDARINILLGITDSDEKETPEIKACNELMDLLEEQWQQLLIDNELR